MNNSLHVGTLLEIINISISSNFNARGFKNEAVSADTSLNMKIVFNLNDHNFLDDAKSISRRFTGFRRTISRRNEDTNGWGGFLLNMREFIRAMHIGTRQTIRVKNQSTQTDPHLLEVSGHCIFSQETYFNSEDTFFDSMAPYFPDPQ